MTDIVATMAPIDVLKAWERWLASHPKEAMQCEGSVWAAWYEGWKAHEAELSAEPSQAVSLTDLRGIAPGATGDQSSEDFVRSLRDAHPQPPAIDAEAAAREIYSFIENNDVTGAKLLLRIAAIISRHTGKEGWMLVPREPTKGMCEAGGKEFMEARFRTSTVEQQDADRIYKAMLSAIEEKR